ncbi:T9SS type B sorting domain-containing protein [Zunongwangia sp. F363]|uniref:T9SS type B sorting domain-containing protein n=1 Tax=Autumnicola tepida TaxID=3075595 RepID=A0ABU3C889_9FLAO|nr:T9SS type B sorting domain-containing protein [Zunongwangia sp. F363]MDT0642417.1 T9SS type B sorting domain-containing protein [Zunongwangia sp. F363]
MKRGLLILTLIFLLCGWNGSELYAQGGLCESIEPFCAGSEELVFENSNPFNGGVPNGQVGPDYGCLLTQPYPAWFFLQIESSGNLSFMISQFQNQDGTGAQLDVDYIAWGPFDREDDYCNNTALSSGNMVSCSYSEAARENLTISNAQAGDIYVVLITNFSRSQGYISLQQTNSSQPGAGATDCSILESALGEDRVVCGENSIVLDGSSDEATDYEWYMYDENAGNYNLIPGETDPTLEVTADGNYRVVVTDSSDGSTAQDDVNVSFYNEPVAALPQNFVACATEEGSVDLTQANAAILSGNSAQENYQVIYYETEEAAEEGQAINTPQAYEWGGNAEVFANVVGQQSGCKSETISFEIINFNFDDPGLEEITAVCTDGQGNLLNNIIMGSDLGSQYSYEWFQGSSLISTNPVLTLNTIPTSDEVSLVLTDNGTGCTRTYQTSLEYFSAPAEVLVQITGSDFDGGYIVTAEAVPGPGNETEYEYQLDNGNWQSGNVFEEVQPGTHMVNARDINGCGATASRSFDLLGYMRFFTPNSDGYNDSWNLVFADDLEVEGLYIFDRYGKLLKQISPNGSGWDGTFNGRNMPADDYWFKIKFLNEENGELNEYSGHFSLIR